MPNRNKRTFELVWYILPGAGALAFVAAAWLLDQGRLNVATNGLLGMLIVGAFGLLGTTSRVPKRAG